MRIRRLDLRRFGPFTDRTLSFDGGDFGLHIVYGSNEAGKSSSLRALHQLLFGIQGEKSCRDNFVHNHGDLRVGGVLESHLGEPFEFMRRKGAKNSLRAADDKSMVDIGHLNDLLGSIDAKRFASQFGIDYHQLVAGGKSIVNGGGDVGASLFAAGSGAADIQQVMKTLQQDCEKLFKVGGKNPLINAGMSQLTAARKAVREAQLPGSEWQKHDTLLKEAQDKKDEVAEKIVQQQAAHDRLQRFHDALPLIAELKEKREALDGLKNVPSLRNDFAEARREATTELKAANTAKVFAEQELEELSTAIEKLTEPTVLLEHGSAIERLFTELGHYEELVKECPELESRQRQHESGAKRGLLDLGKTEDSENAGGLRISSTKRQRIRKLGDQRSAIVKTANDTEKDLERRKSDLEAAQKQLDALTEPADTKSLRRAIKRAQKQGDLDEQLAEAVNVLKQNTDQANIDLKKLPLWSGMIEELEALAVPSVDSIRSFEDRMAEVEHTAKQHDDRLREFKAELLDIKSRLQELTLQQDVPTEDDLAEIRRQREEAWLLVKDSLENYEPASGSQKQLPGFDTGSEVAETFEDLVVQSDEIVDRLRREAERVAEKVRLIADQQKLTKKSDDCQSDLGQTNDQRKQIEKEWKSLWKPTSIKPLAPGDMICWMSQHANLVAAAERIRQQEATIADLESKIASHCEELSKERQQPGAPELASNSLSALIDECECHCEELEELSLQHKTLTQQITALQNEQLATEAAAKDASERKAEWEQQWAEAVAPLKHDEDLTPSEAGVVLDTIDRLLTDTDAASKIMEEITLKQNEIKVFEDNVRQLTEQLNLSSADTVAQTVADLHDRLKTAHKNEATRNSKSEQHETLTQQLHTTLLNISRHTANLEELCREAGCENADELPTIEQQSTDRRELEQQVSALTTSLQKLAGGTDLTTFMESAVSEDADTLKPLMQQLDAEVYDLKSEIEQLSETIGREQNELSKMDGGSSAANAREDVEGIVTKLRSDSEEYVRLKLAAGILKRGIERYRKRNQGPVLERASELFRSLTLEAFTGLQPDVNDAGDPVLVGIRPDGGKLVTVDGMSEGTCDQLYLALRLASLENHFRDAPPMPFIVDDILIQFDDARSVAALQALADLSKQTQVIMFTHHQHVVELAKQHVTGEGVMFTQSLEDRVFVNADG